MSATRSSVFLLAAAALCLAGVACAGDGRSPNEQELIAVLRSDAPEADKAKACKQLAVHGSADAVPELAKLLGNERLSAWARIPLEAIPDPACDAALRQAAAGLAGRPLVGVINSLGARRDAGAVDLLAARLADADAAVASSAAIALGLIGGEAAAAALRPAVAAPNPAVRNAAAEACVICAEGLAAGGRAADAVALCDLVRKADVPPQRVVEATRGAILARGAAGVPLLVEQLRSADERMFAIGLSVARELRGPEVDAALETELSTAVPARAAVVVDALADRGGPRARQVLAALAERRVGPREVRLAAVRSLGRIGDEGGLAPLLVVAAETDADLAAVAKTAIADLPGQGVDQALRVKLAGADAAKLPLLLDLVGKRRVAAALPDVLAALKSGDTAVREAALTALGETIDLERLNLLVERVAGSDDAGESAATLAALRTACVRMPDRDACAARLEPAIASAPMGTRIALLEIVGDVGGGRALGVVNAAAKSDQEPLRDAGTRLLGKWMTADAAPVLIDLAKTLPDGKYRDRALKGYLRIARQLAANEAERVAMCRTILGLARDDADRQIVFDAIRGMPNADAVRKAVEAQ
ncbi:MAG: HEAT repeat domain-containing protein [Planctomycetaceae bacterium]|jgi:HEAT repeat protein|nr:HEAT repeat domain-containing protein [Planctomycetaceae bacterium]